MTRTLVKMSKGALCAAVIASCLVFSSTAQAQVEIRLFPPAAFIATSSPVYFEGRASYWYQGRWYYRDGRAWRYYQEEPTHLRERRIHHSPPREYYGRGHKGGHRGR